VRLMRLASPLFFALALAAGSASNATAQTTVTSGDIQRLQDTINDTSRAIAQMRSVDERGASQLQAELDDATDEATYLKVKIQKNEPIGRSEYADVRDRVENIRNRARGDDNRPVSAPGAPAGTPYPNDSRYPGEDASRPQNPNEIGVGTEFDVRLQSGLSSKTIVSTRPPWWTCGTRMDV
jgi:TolA-binding protein